MTPLFKRFDHLFLAQTIDNQSDCAVMVKTMLEYFFKLRIHHMCRQQRAAERGRTVRQFLTKLVHQVPGTTPAPWDAYLIRPAEVLGCTTSTVGNWARLSPTRRLCVPHAEL
ncbi:hypothetical protein HPB47_003876 [Ixodes persulcatus]|uniref:Uncharacterized protein n=1 Tax=Ixodes persulcatus TaxID=34615 RepID=A0AC60PIL6_IXOPE|nr:hypothetical protein HPB47_003876 [Ixodes persulcatus]